MWSLTPPSLKKISVVILAWGLCQTKYRSVLWNWSRDWLLSVYHRLDEIWEIFIEKIPIAEEVFVNCCNFNPISISKVKKAIIKISYKTILSRGRYSDLRLREAEAGRNNFGSTPVVPVKNDVKAVRCAQGPVWAGEPGCVQPPVPAGEGERHLFRPADDQAHPLQVHRRSLIIKLFLLLKSIFDGTSSFWLSVSTIGL